MSAPNIIGRARIKAKKYTKASVRDLPEPKPTKLSSADVKTLEDAGFGKLAKMVEPYVSR
jgi:hypothetical protein